MHSGFADDENIGTGTILDAWKLGLPLIVVPNTRLLDDHQTEMAKHLAKKGYATMSTPRYVFTQIRIISPFVYHAYLCISRSELQEAIPKAVLLWEENKATRWPPHNVRRDRSDALRLWDIKPMEVKKEEVAQMSHD